MEVERQVNTFKVDIKCPDCEIILSKDKMGDMFVYTCVRCQMKHKCETDYPYLKYKFK